MELSEYMVKKIKEMSDKYYLILEPEMVNVSFWYIPPRLRNTPHTPEKEKLLGDVSSFIFFFYTPPLPPFGIYLRQNGFGKQNINFN